MKATIEIFSKTLFSRNSATMTFPAKADMYDVSSWALE